MNGRWTTVTLGIMLAAGAAGWVRQPKQLQPSTTLPVFAAENATASRGTYQFRPVEYREDRDFGRYDRGRTPVRRVWQGSDRRGLSSRDVRNYSYRDNYNYRDNGDYRRGRIEDERSAGKSALIIGGSAATGAAIGGLAGGGKGAAIGAVSGGAAGLIYDRLTRKNRDSYDRYRR